jgi:hypothetical protein
MAYLSLANEENFLYFFGFEKDQLVLFIFPGFKVLHDLHHEGCKLRVLPSVVLGFSCLTCCLSFFSISLHAEVFFEKIEKILKQEFLVNLNMDD